ncbi:MAG: TonB-dependent receptor [Acidobacteria bacterium]|nr:TonB-dependent receptor [Acidobacteriota bacterium]
MNQFRHRSIYLLAATLLMLALFVAPVAAQVLYGSITGLIEDPSGSVVPGAKAVATNTATGQVYEGTSNADGTFTILNVLPGTYDLKVTSQGFKTVSRTGLAINGNIVTRTDIRLEVGSLGDQITVAADAVTLQTDKADTHSEISKGLVKAMPLPGFRNYQSLINLVPGATPAVFQNSITDTPGRSLSTNINGTNRNNNVTRIDGAASVNLWLPHHAGYVTPAEMVENVNITTTAGDAEQGFAGGAAVSVITKSGTNEFHGSAFEFHDNQRLRARNFFFTPTTVKPVRIYNNFGGTIGGPIVKNKFFFFYSYDNTKQRDAAFNRYSVPTLDIRGGDFRNTGTTIFDPLTSPDVAANRSPFPENRIPANRIATQAQRIQAFYPNPNIAGVALNNYAIGATPQFNRRYHDIKLNYNRNSKHSMWGRYGQMNALVGGRGIFGDGVGPAPGSDPGLGDTAVRNMSMGQTYTITPTLLYDGVVGYQRQDQVVQGQDFGKDFSTQLGIPGIGGPDLRQQGFPNININGYNGFGVPGWMPLSRIEENFTMTQSLRWIKGKHNFAFGFDGVLFRMNHWQPELGNGPRGGFNFNGGAAGNGSFNNFNAYAAFLLGAPVLMQKSVQNILATAREWQFGFYAQDRWQVSRKLTVNFGLRYENYPLMGRSNGKGIERLDPETNIVTLGGRGNVPRNNGFTVNQLMFAPRLGVAYRLDENTVIRTGYGINFSPLPWSRPLRGFYPVVINSVFPAPNDNTSIRSLAEGIPPLTLPNIDSGSVTLPPSADMRTPISGQITRGYTQSWNFTIERKLPGQFITSVAYVGTQSVHLAADRDINSGQVIGAGNAGRPYSSRFGRNISTLLWDGQLSSRYHGFQTSIRRQAKGLTVQGAYTWSKAINATDDEGWAGTTWNWTPVYGRNIAPAGYDRRHVLQMGWVYDLPVGKGQKFTTSKALDYVVGGWTLSGITAAFTGTPFTPSAPGGTLNLPGNAQTPDQVNLTVGRPEGIGPNATFYDTSAFRNVILNPGEVGRFGSMGRNSLRNPGVLRHDLTLSKTFVMRERFSLALRGEAYNFTNSRLSTGFASNDVTNPNFLRVLGASDERQFRVALRFGF